MNQYAVDHGYDPAGSWVLIVYHDGLTDMVRFEDHEEAEAWCDAMAPVLRRMLRDEKTAGGSTAG